MIIPEELAIVEEALHVELEQQARAIFNGQRLADNHTTYIKPAPTPHTSHMGWAHQGYVISVNFKGFSKAPSTMIDVVNRLTWVGKKVLNDGTYQQSIGLLCLGYFEK